MVNGSVNDYIKKYPTVDHFAMVSASRLKHIRCLLNFSQIKGICEGLNVLHNMVPPIVHGDLRAV